MVLKELRLCQFRCVSEIHLSPDSKFNAFIGLNGQGKTSILEAIGMLARLRSFRNAKNEELVLFGHTEAKVSGVITNDGLEFDLAVRITGGRKSASLNGKISRYLSDYINQLASVTFSPIDLEIIHTEPAQRRNWIDQISQILFIDHLDLANRYQKTLQNRNKQLRLFAERAITRLPQDFEIWTDQLVKVGAEITLNRFKALEFIVPRISKFFNKILGLSNDFIESSEKPLSSQYLSTVFNKPSSEEDNKKHVQDGAQDEDRQLRSISLEIIIETFQKSLYESLSKECVLGSTSVGPHRDDLEFYFRGKLVRAFGSQGQIRSLVLAMRLAEADLYHTERGQKPLLLIDDFSSELDAEKRRFLLDYLCQCGSQVFLTSTEPVEIGKTFQINNGKVLTNDHGSLTYRHK